MDFLLKSVANACLFVNCSKDKRCEIWTVLPNQSHIAYIWNNVFKKQIPGCILEEGIDYRQNNIGGPVRGVTSAQACAEHSLSIGGSHWTYDYSNANCWVKSSDSLATTNTDAISGTAACAFPQLAPLGVATSRRLEENPPELCADSNSTTFCVAGKAKYSWVALHLGLKARISRVEIRNRADCCGDKLRNIEVRVTNTLPTKGIFNIKKQSYSTKHISQTR